MTHPHDEHDESAAGARPPAGPGRQSDGSDGACPADTAGDAASALIAGASGQVSNEALEQGSGLQRSLTNRHMQMIAIGGAIGTGLFVASGATVSTAGPGGALVAYAAIGLMVLLLM